jgi:hypothetical protein
VTAPRRFRVVVSILLYAAAMLIAAAVSALFDGFAKGVDAGPQRLLYHTDHAAVLRACREVLADPQKAGFQKSPSGYSEVNGSQSGITPPTALPAALRELNFEFMNVEGDQATIFFGGGFGHWGFSTAPSPGNAQVVVIPGLWFWSEFRLPPDPAHATYYHTSLWLLLGSALMVGAAIVVARRLRRGMRAELQD